jgi:hypothetical protein
MRFSIIAAVLIVAVASAQADDAELRSYPLPKHGTFELRVPAAWKDSVTQPPNGLPPTITFSPKSGAPFQVMVTPIWPARPDAKVLTPDELKASVKRAADGAAPQAVETTIEVKELKGPANTGYYFAATDRAPKQGEFKILNQGMIGVGDLRVAFTILTNDGQDAVVKDALSMLSGAARSQPRQ